jgi:predicted MFS family arabinose efflux permease
MPPFPENSRRIAWVAVGLLWFVALLNYLDRLVITTMHDSVVASIPMSEAQFGLLSSVFLWVYGILSPTCGFLADRFSRRRVIFVSLLVWSAVTWATGHAQTFQQLFWARAAMGVSEACYLPAALALIADHHRKHTRSFATALHGTGIYAGGALGGIGGYLADTIGWRAGFTLLGAVGIGYALVLLVFLRDSAEPPAEDSPDAVSPDIKPMQALRALFSVPAFGVMMLVNSVVGVTNWTVYGWLPTYFREQFSLSQSQAGFAATVILQAASFLGIMGGGVVADRLSRRSNRARMLMPGFGYLLAAPALLVLANTGNLTCALVGLGVYGLARGFFDANLMPIVRQSVSERFSATAYGFLNLIGCVTGGAMTYFGGVLRDARISLAIVFELCAAGILIAALLLLFLKPRHQ